MNILCVYFPRLPVQAALRNRPRLAGREIVLVTGAGEDALVTATTSGPALDGVVPGMRAADARRLSPRAAFSPAGIAQSLDVLEPAADLIRGRVTPFIEIGGIDHLFVGITDVGDDIRLSAQRIAALVRTWSGLDVRVGAGPSRASAFVAARCARGGVGVDHLAAVVSDVPIAPWRRDEITAVASLATPRHAASLAGRLASMLSARDQGWRSFRLTTADGTDVSWRSPEPVYASAMIEERLRAAVEDGCGHGPVRLTLGGLVPDLRVMPYLGTARNGRLVSGASALSVTPPQIFDRSLRAAG